MITITFYGAARTTTGSMHLVEANGRRILLDCGLYQGHRKEAFEVNRNIPFEPRSLDAVILSHAHIDHSGKIPFLVASGFHAPVDCTEATSKLCSIMLRDSAHVQEFEAGWRNRKAARSGDEFYTPLYTAKDVEHTLPLLVGHPYGQSFALAEGIEVCFFDAGHLLGSASILVTVTENGLCKRLLFSGDLGNSPRPLICAPAQPPRADYVVCEST